MTQKKRIKSEYEKAERQADAFGEAMRSDMRRLFRSYIAEFKSVLADMPITESDVLRLREQTKLINDLRGILDRAGYPELVANYRERLDIIGEKSLDYFRAFNIKPDALAGLPQEVFQAASGSFVDSLNVLIDSRLVRPTETLVRNTLTGAQTRQQAVDSILSAINNNGILRRDGNQWTDANIEVFVNDSGRRFQQTVRAQAAKELELDIVLYVGPLDEKNREFCHDTLTEAPHGVPGMYYADEIEPEALVTAGGFNCRHRFMFIDLETAKGMGFRE